MAGESVGEEHTSFMYWALSHGVEINGVAPANFPGRRLGMVASRVIEEGEIMITVPLDLMITIDTIPSSFAERFPEGTPIQGILAAFLTHGDSDFLSKWDAWRKVWPPRRDFEESMPLLWPKHLRATDSSHDSSSLYPNQSLLPPSASGRWNTIRKEDVSIEYETKYQIVIPQQEKRFQDAWKSTISVFPETDWDTWTYYWLIVNTRSFFYVSLGKDAPANWNDALALVPFADYFNHMDHAPCDVNFDGEIYTFTAARRHEKGEEVFMSYGSHPNDFLFVEYGFYLEDNESDAIFLDDIIFREFTRSEKDDLNAYHYFGNYQVTLAGVCSRTQVAACMKYMTRGNWRNYVRGESTRGTNRKKTSNIIQGWIESYLKECNSTMETIESMLAQKRSSATTGPELHGNEEAKLEMLLNRWKQIKKLCETALNTIT